MVMNLKYDQLVQKFLDEGRAVSRSEARRLATLTEGREIRGEDVRAKEKKSLNTLAFEAHERGAHILGIVLHDGAKQEAKQMLENRISQPKKRGRPKGSRNKPKVLKSP